MIDKLKDYAVQVIARKMLPSLIRAAIAGLVGLLVAHSGVLSSLGIAYDSASQTITLHLGMLQDWLVAGGLGLVTALLTALQHHTTAAITGQPQDGTHQRSTDPKPPEPPAAPPTGLIGLLVVLGCLGLAQPGHCWNPVTDVQTNLKWTLGEEASIGTAYKIGGSGETKVGKRGDSAMFGIFDYRFIKMSYGAISNPQDGAKIGDGLKTGLMLNYFLGWFKSPQTPAMQLFNNINIGPTVTIPLLSDAHPLKFPSVWLEANYRFGPRN